MFYYKESVVLTQDYIDNLGNNYKKGQTGTVRSTPDKEDKTVIVIIDGYKESENSNIIDYVTEIPISVLESRIVRRFL